MSDLTIKSVTTAVVWEYRDLPPSKLRCALCLVDCSQTSEGPTQELGIVRTHRSCGAVAHEACLSKFRQSASGNSCPQCHEANATFSSQLDLFGVKATE